MRSLTGVLSTALLLASGLAIADAGAADRVSSDTALIDASRFRPVLTFHEVETVSDSEFVTITGVVFSRSPIDRVTVGDRAATLRPVEPRDLVSIKRVPRGATELPFRTYFEVPDAVLSRIGANDVDVVAATTEGRKSDIHRVTILRINQRDEVQQ